MIFLEDEDWIKTGHWDFPGVDSLDELLYDLKLHMKSEDEQAERLRHFITLPCYVPAPEHLKNEVTRFLAAHALVRSLPPKKNLLQRLFGYKKAGQ